MARCSDCGGSGENRCYYSTTETSPFPRILTGFRKLETEYTCSGGRLKSRFGSGSWENDVCPNCNGRGFLRCSSCGGSGMDASQPVYSQPAYSASVAVTPKRTWDYCGLSEQECSCTLERVCARDKCECGRPKVCVSHDCNCKLLKMCSDINCSCSRPKVCTVKAG